MHSKSSVAHFERSDPNHLEKMVKKMRNLAGIGKKLYLCIRYQQNLPII